MWLDRAIKWLLPREEHFFDLLEKGADCALEASRILVQLCESQDPTARDDLLCKLRDSEHHADLVIHEVYDALNRTFVTPMDRTDIYALSTDLEDITDWIQSTADQIAVHDMEDLPPGSKDLATQIQQACEQIQGAVKLLRSLKNPDEIRARCKTVGRLEHEGDRIFHAQMGEMFKHEKDAVRLLKHKEFLEGLENTLDACDDVANALESVVIKNA